MRTSARYSVGPSAAIAPELGRRYIAIEIDPRYAQLARRRLSSAA